MRCGATVEVEREPVRCVKEEEHEGVHKGREGAVEVYWGGDDE